MALEGRTVYVVGGQQKPGAHYKGEAHRHRKGVILRIDPEMGKVETCVEYVSPPDVCPDRDPSILFKAATLLDDRLFVCTQTEVLVYHLPDFRQLSYLSLPCFNDVHHVRPTLRGTVLVVSTGLDMVVEATLDGGMVRAWNVLGGDPWGRASRDTDYRKIASTKPHASHPNYVFVVGDDIWVTRFEQKDAVCLTDPSRRIPIGIGKPHDGIVHGDRVYFTTVNGHVVIADPAANRVLETIDLNAGMAGDRSLGWCRGLLVLDEQRFLIAFSRLRPTKFVENVQWAQYKVGRRAAVGYKASHIALWDRKAGAFRWEQNLEDAGLSVIFSLHLDQRV